MKTIAGIASVLLFAGIHLAGDGSTTAEWIKLDEGVTGARDGSMLVHLPDRKQLLLVGPAKGPFIQAFDPTMKAWSDVSAAGPTKDAIHPYYQTAYDPGTKTIYCLSGGPVLYAFHTVDKTWKAFPPAPELKSGNMPTTYHQRWHVELDLRSILRCQTPAMVRKEFWAHLLAYDLIRKVMAQAA